MAERLRRRPAFWVAAALLSILVLMAVAPELFLAPSPASPDPFACSLRGPDGEFRDRLPPSHRHWFGTDVQGCDYYARVVHGARASLAVGLVGVALALAVAVVLGSLAGFYGGTLDAAVSRLIDAVFAFPALVGAILLLGVLGLDGRRSLLDVGVVIGLVGWPLAARMVRGQVLAVRHEVYVEAARLTGASGPSILLRHVLPNALAPVVAYATLAAGGAITAEATLSFLGVGLQLPAVSWGLMIGTARPRLATSPHLLAFPTLFLFLAVLAFVLLGDVLRDALDRKGTPAGPPR